LRYQFTKSPAYGGLTSRSIRVCESTADGSAEMTVVVPGSTSCLPNSGKNSMRFAPLPGWRVSGKRSCAAVGRPLQGSNWKSAGTATTTRCNHHGRRQVGSVEITALPAGSSLPDQGDGEVPGPAPLPPFLRRLQSQDDQGIHAGPESLVERDSAAGTRRPKPCIITPASQ